MKESLDLLLSSYDYPLNQELIAQVPLEPRHDARMLVVNDLKIPNSKSTHLKIWDFQYQVSRKDLIVFNNTRVIHARLKISLKSGSKGELLLIEPHGEGRWLCLARPAKKLKGGTSILLESPGNNNINLTVIRKDSSTGGLVIQFPKFLDKPETIESFLREYGEVPLPPYIKTNDLTNGERYQTRYATRPGAVAAPTAGLHFSDELLQELSDKGIRQGNITLHVGLGTFKPIDLENLSSLKLHQEWVEVTEELVREVECCKHRGGKVIAIGTTTVRALEGAYSAGEGRLKPFRGKTDLVIKPGHVFGVVDGLLTNFHLPKSSLLLLVSALIGREKLMALYAEAIKRHYRFFSYGDAMWIPPSAVLPEARLAR